MNIGEILLIVGTLVSLAAFALRFLTTREDGEKYAKMATLLSIGTFIVVTAALVLLIYLFLSSDMGFYYVWRNSSSSLQTLYKLTGVWVGAEGTLLLWIWFMTLGLAVDISLKPGKRILSERFRGVFQTAILGVVSLFMTLLLTVNLFEATEARIFSGFLQVYPDGYGMSMQLQTPEMAIHPPVIFAGYAFGAIVLAASFAFLITKDKNWAVISLPWARLAWLLLTAGIGIGAIWAYYVIGWGGYWAWDPVETSSLFPWFISTAFLHTQLRFWRNKEYKLLSPLLGIALFISILFATFITRAGGIWAASVHSFGERGAGTAMSRLTDILSSDMTVLGMFILMLALFAVIVFIAYARTTSVKKEEEKPEPEKISGYIGDSNNMMLAILLMVLAAVIATLLLLKNTDASQAANYFEFNQKMSILFAALMMAMSVCLVWRDLGKERTFWFAVALIGVSIAIAAAAAATDAADAMAAFVLPSSMMAIATSAYKIARTRFNRALKIVLKDIGPNLVHLGVALVLTGFVVSTNAQSLISPQGSADIGIGGEAQVGGYTLRLLDLTSVNFSQPIEGSTVSELRNATIGIIDSGQSQGYSVVLTNMFGSNQQGSNEKLHGTVYIHKSLADDLYISFDWKNSTTAVIQARTLPLMNALWGGLGLLMVGIVLRTVGWKETVGQQEVEDKSESGQGKGNPAEKKKRSWDKK